MHSNPHNFKPENMPVMSEHLVGKLRELVERKFAGKKSMRHVFNHLDAENITARLYINEKFQYCFIFDLLLEEPMSIPIVTEEDMEALFEGMSLYDYIVLCEHALYCTIGFWKEQLRTKSKRELKEMFNETQTYKEAYEERIQRAQDFESHFSEYMSIGEAFHFNYCKFFEFKSCSNLPT